MIKPSERERDFSSSQPLPFRAAKLLPFIKIKETFSLIFCYLQLKIPSIPSSSTAYVDRSQRRSDVAATGILQTKTGFFAKNKAPKGRDYIAQCVSAGYVLHHEIFALYGQYYPVNDLSGL